MALSKIVTLEPNATLNEINRVINTVAYPLFANNTNSSASGAFTLDAADVTGARGIVILRLNGTQSGGVNVTLPLAVNAIARIPNYEVGDFYLLLVINTSGQTLTMTTNTGWSVTSANTVLTSNSRLFMVTAISATSLNLGNVGIGITP